MEQLHNLTVMGVSFFSIVLTEDGCKAPWKIKYSYKDFASIVKKIFVMSSDWWADGIIWIFKNYSQRIFPGV